MCKEGKRGRGRGRERGEGEERCHPMSIPCKASGESIVCKQKVYYTCNIGIDIDMALALLGCITNPIRVRRMFFSNIQSPLDSTILSRRGIQDPAALVSCVGPSHNN